MVAGGGFGGFVAGMGSQIFILSQLDSIAGSVVLFVAITALGAWFMTSGPCGSVSSSFMSPLDAGKRARGAIFTHLV